MDTGVLSLDWSFSSKIDPMPMKIRHLILRQSYFKIVQDSFFSQQMVAERILMNPFLFLFYILKPSK